MQGLARFFRPNVPDMGAENNFLAPPDRASDYSRLLAPKNFTSSENKLNVRYLESLYDTYVPFWLPDHLTSFFELIQISKYGPILWKYHTLLPAVFFFFLSSGFNMYSPCWPTKAYPLHLHSAVWCQYTGTGWTVVANSEMSQQF